MKKLASALIAWLVLLTPAYGKELPLKLNFAKCAVPAAGLPESAASLMGSHAQYYKPYLVICPVFDKGGTEVLKILALQAYQAAIDKKLYFLNGKPWDYGSGADFEKTDPIPQPVILTMADKPLGRLPEQLFPDGAGWPTVTFSEWRNDMPQRISVRVDDAGVIGTYCTPPLIWNAAQGRYIQKPGDEFQNCPGQP